MVDTPEHFDVLIVGAGISGIGGAYHLTQQVPGKSFVVLETQGGFGGTWRTHTYPGIRSDSDLFTFGYRFKPWTGDPIASAEEIQRYLGEVIDENDLAQHIRYHHRIDSATWDSDQKRWTLDATNTETGESLTFTGGFLWMCQGYYRHAEGYTPDWEGMDDFGGRIVHPMEWPDDVEYEGKKVVVIGSGATAATIIPAMADDTEHITMLQRSPTFFAAERTAYELADMLRELDIPDEWTHEIVRRKVLKEQDDVAKASEMFPDLVREELGNQIKRIMGDEYDLDPHFNPTYRPWQQRIAYVPEGDLFHSIKDGKASVVTDHIERFTETGIELASGEHLDADLIITATGFNMNVLGDIDFSIDGAPLDFASTVGYRGTMFTDIPNMAWVFGYFRASWTLRVDIIADFVCRLLQYMDDKGVDVVVPKLRDSDDGMELLPWVDPENFNPGYIMRAAHLLPKQGTHQPWLHTQDYMAEKDELPVADLDDGALIFE